MTSLDAPASRLGTHRLARGYFCGPCVCWRPPQPPKPVSLRVREAPPCPPSAGFFVSVSGPVARNDAVARKTPPQVGPGRGFQRAVRRGGLFPGLRTERRDQDDTPKGKMVRPRLPDVVNARNHLRCCARATVRPSQSASSMRGAAMMIRALVSEKDLRSSAPTQNSLLPLTPQPRPRLQPPIRSLRDSRPEWRGKSQEAKGLDRQIYASRR